MSFTSLLHFSLFPSPERKGLFTTAFTLLALGTLAALFWPGAWLDGVTVSASTADITATVVDQRMTASVAPPGSGCPTPVTKTAFSTSDKEAIHWTSLSGIRVNDLIKWEFVQPNGNVFFSSEARFTFSGGGCAWEVLPIAGNPTANLPGNWQVRVIYNGALLLTANFTIAVGGGPAPTAGAAIIIDGTDANEHGDNNSGRGNDRGWLYMQKALENLAAKVPASSAKVVITLGTESGKTARNAIDSAFRFSTLPGAGWTINHVDGAANVANWMNTLSASTTGLLYLPTYHLATGDLEAAELAAINAQAVRLANFINRGDGNGGALFAMGENDTTTEKGAWGWLQALLPGLVVTQIPGSGGVTSAITLTPDGLAAFPGLTNTIMAGADPWHNYFTGNLGTLKVLATAPQSGTPRNLVIGGIGITVTPPPTPTPTPTPTPGGNRLLRVACGSGRPGGTVTLPLEIVAQGDENALGVSLTFDPNVLSNPQVTRGGDAAAATLNLNTSQLDAGRLGLALALGSGQRFAAGTRQFALVTFNVNANTMNNSTYVEFGDAPIRRQVANANAQALNADYQGCNNVRIEITTGYEADVTPRPNGKNDGSIAITDWVMVGRFAAGLDTPNSGSEFQRADCAPRDSKGDGQMGIVDWVQAGRFAAGLDAVQTVGGPSAASFVETETALSEAPRTPMHGRHLRVVGATVQRGQSVDVAVEIEAAGDENAFGFSLAFDPAALTYVAATAGDGLGNAQLNLNAAQAASGRVGFALALPAGTALTAGQRVLLTVRFTALASGTATTTALAFGDQPIRRQLSDANANALSAEFENAVITIQADNTNNRVTNVSAASYQPLAAAETIMAAFGSGLATMVNVATQLPLPMALAGASVKIKDSAGVERLAPLFFVSPNQINYLMPAATATGAATVTITSGNGATATGAVNVTNTAPSLFAANATGQGLAAAVALRVKPDGALSYEPVADYDAALGRFVPRPLDLGAANEQVFLILFGTGWRGLRNLSAASAAFAEVSAPVLYVGAQGSLAGLDQVNLAVPRTLAGRGLVNLMLNAEGSAANPVQIQIK